MRAFSTKQAGRRATSVVAVAIAWWAVAQPASAQPGFDLGERTVPTQAHDMALAALASGDFQGALQIAGREYQAAI
ncbi:MAG: hypothetical protein O3A37_15020, partial [Planctomycetota bacterium]|nr:hypothetical protein [Planctomycetota bacterium]